jgi:aromatic-L-amino-acid/L-tryptophan decarboxylase
MRSRRSPIDMDAAEFREIGHALVDRIAAFYESLPERPVTPGESARAVRERLGERSLPTEGAPAARLLGEAADLLFDHSLHNGHPRFFGYITSSAAPLGALADLLAAAVNPNVGLWDLAPMASEIERQVVRWLAELIGYPAGGDGLMVSGGNMANVVGFVAARRARLPWDVRRDGLRGGDRRPVLYASRETHTWIEKAADVCGLGTSAVRWVDTDSRHRLCPDALERADPVGRRRGDLPFLVVGTAGNVSTGAVDPLPALAAICARHGLWLHVDGAYGAPAAALPEASEDLRGLALADSVALDPHKWLYSPIEAGCTLVRDPEALVRAFRFRPPYYPDAVSSAGGELRGVDHHERGLQNTRGFRALKVWLSLQHVGREGHVALIREDIALARHLHDLVAAHPELEAFAQNLEHHHLSLRATGAGGRLGGERGGS